MLEAKWSDAVPAPAFSHFKTFLPEIHQIQLVKELKRETMFPNGVEIRKLIPWLIKLDLTKKNNQYNE